MVQKPIFLLAAGIGLVLLVALMFAGTDPHLARRTGPRWRRYLIAAAVVFLSALGIRYVSQERGHVVCYAPRRVPFAEQVKHFKGEVAALEAQVSSRTLKPEVVAMRVAELERRLNRLASGTYPERPDWEHVAESARPRIQALRRVLLETAHRPEVTAEWWDIQNALDEWMARGQRGIDAQRAQSGTDLDAADVAASLLLQRGLIGEAEARLLVNETRRCRGLIRANLPGLPDQASTREAVDFYLEHLAQQEPVLERIENEGRLTAAVSYRALQPMDEVIAVLSKSGVLKVLPESRRSEAEGRLRVVRELLHKIRQFKQKKDDGWLES